MLSRETSFRRPGRIVCIIISAVTTRRRRQGTTREEVVNTLLAQELRRHGLSARAERRSREGTPDVRIELRGGELVLLECKWESSAALLDEQLNRRLAQFPEAIGVLGVVYPDLMQIEDDIQEALSFAADLSWRLHGSRGNVMPGWPERFGSVSDMADQLRLLPLELEGTDRVAAAAGVVGYALEKAVAPLRQHEHIAARIAEIIAEADKESDRLAALLQDLAGGR